MGSEMCIRDSFRGDREKIREMLRKGRILKQHNAAEKKMIYE